MDTSKFTPGVIVILAAGLVMLVFSFLPFYKLDGGGGGRVENAEEACEGLPDDLADECRDALGDAVEDAGGGDQNFTAWSNDGLFPVTTLPVLYAVAMAVLVGLQQLANVKFPEKVLGLTWPAVYIALGFNAALLMLASLVLDKGVLDFGIGFFFMLIAAIAAIVGAVLYSREAAAGPATPPPPPPAAPPTA